ncbi:MAG: hypothetical protein RBS24_06900, partial [Bacilli bacterium]|nr:hypothetical protein [Bacilli bacterium]
MVIYANNLIEDKYKKEFILRNFINTDKDFIYFGRIYSRTFDDSLYIIDYYNIKDFTSDIIP